MQTVICDFESEQNVIGACLLDNDVIGRIDYLTVDDFTNQAHKEMFSAILKLHGIGKYIDMMELDLNVDPSIVGFDYITEVVKNTSSARNIVSNADRVKDASNKRKAYDCMIASIEQLSDRRVDSVGVLTDVSKCLDEILYKASTKSTLTVTEMINASLDEMEKSNLGIRVGIKSGIEEIDDRLGYKSLAFGEITALGALSKNGKTLMANTIAARAEYLDDETCHIFSIEMSELSMFNGIVSAMSGVPSDFYVQQKFYSETYPSKYDNMMARWGAAANELHDSNRITIDGNKDVNVDYLINEIRKSHERNRQEGKRLRLVIIDHAHQMTYPGNDSTTEKMGEASRRLKKVASELDLSIVWLVQLSNKCEGKDPTSFDILDTSRIRHNLQAFIGTRIFRENGQTYFGVYGDSQRYGNQNTLHHPAYMKLIGGVLRPLPEGEQHWTPSKEEQEKKQWSK